VGKARVTDMPRQKDTENIEMKNRELSNLKHAAIAYALKRCPLFSDLGPEDVGEIVGFTVSKSVDKGDQLFREGDPSHGFYVVLKGAVSVHRVNALGKEQVIHVFRDGETFGEGSLAVPTGYPADAVAVEASQVLLIQKDGFVEVLRRRPEMAVRMLAIMSKRLRMLLGQMEGLRDKSVECRLAEWLVGQCPDADERGSVVVDLTTTKKVLAAELGTVSETLSRSLARLREDGLITVEGRRITVKCPAALMSFAGVRAG
jgi:CRP-like cAMP-binding protein